MRSGVTEAHFRTDGGTDLPLLLFIHVNKTAGTSLRQMIRGNLPPCETETWDETQRLESRAEVEAWYRDWYAELDDDRRRRLVCVMGHTAGFLLPHVPDAQPLVLVREPVDRVLSAFFFDRRREDKRRPADEWFPKVYGNHRRLPDEWEGVFPRKSEYHNWQARNLLAAIGGLPELPYSDGPPEDADRWREPLFELVDKRALAGTQDRFREFVESLCARFGWRPSFPTEKANMQREPTSALDPAVAEMIRRHNWLDVELYARVAASIRKDGGRDGRYVVYVGDEDGDATPAADGAAEEYPRFRLVLEPDEALWLHSQLTPDEVRENPAAARLWQKLVRAVAIRSADSEPLP